MSRHVSNYIYNFGAEHVQYLNCTAHRFPRLEFHGRGGRIQTGAMDVKSQLNLRTQAASHVKHPCPSLAVQMFARRRSGANPDLYSRLLRRCEKERWGEVGNDFPWREDGGR